MRFLLKLIQAFFWVALLPIRLALMLLSAIMLGASMLGEVVCRILGGIFLFGLIAGLVLPNSTTSTERWQFLIIGSIIMALPLIAGYVSAIPMAIAQFLGELTNPFN